MWDLSFVLVVFYCLKLCEIDVMCCHFPTFQAQLSLQQQCTPSSPPPPSNLSSFFSGKRSEATTLPYERIISASWPQGSSASKTFVLSYAEENGALLRPKTMEVLVGEESEAKKWIKYTNKIIAGKCLNSPKRNYSKVKSETFLGNRTHRRQWVPYFPSIW